MTTKTTETAAPTPEQAHQETLRKAAIHGLNERAKAERAAAVAEPAQGASSAAEPAEFTAESLGFQDLGSSGEPEEAADKVAKADEQPVDDDSEEAAADEDAPEESDDAEEPEEDAEEEPEVAEGEEDAEESDQKPKKSKGVPLRKRLRQERRARGDAERALAAKDAELAALKQAVEEIRASIGAENPKKDAAKAENAGPDPKDFKFGEVDPLYIAALAEYKADTVLQKKLDEIRRAEAAAREEQELAAKRDKAIEAGVAKYDDFEDVVVEGAERGEWALSAEMAQLLVESEVGHDIAYYLAKRPKKSLQIAQLPIRKQLVEFGRLEAQFLGQKAAEPERKKADPSAKATKAPKPVTQPRGDGGKFTISGGTDDFGSLWHQFSGEKPRKF